MDRVFTVKQASVAWKEFACQLFCHELYTNGMYSKTLGDSLESMEDLWDFLEGKGQ